MKITELMLGNWVIAPDEDTRGLKEIRVAQMRKTLVLDKYSEYYCIENLAPIPITEGFLKANGFIPKCLRRPDKHYPQGLYEWEKGVEGNWVTLTIHYGKIGCGWQLHVDNCDRDSIGHVAVEYVHQLQNFMNFLNIEMEVNV